MRLGFMTAQKGRANDAPNDWEVSASFVRCHISGMRGSASSSPRIRQLRFIVCTWLLTMFVHRQTSHHDGGRVNCPGGLQVLGWISQYQKRLR
jgi:hypothetical protein